MLLSLKCAYNLFYVVDFYGNIVNHILKLKNVLWILAKFKFSGSALKHYYRQSTLPHSGRSSGPAFSDISSTAELDAFCNHKWNIKDYSHYARGCICMILRLFSTYNIVTISWMCLIYFMLWIFSITITSKWTAYSSICIW